MAASMTLVASGRIRTRGSTDQATHNHIRNLTSGRLERFLLYKKGLVRVGIVA